jgi:hypothetical protein
MRSLLSQTIATARPANIGSWFPGLPHALATIAIWPIFGAAACVTGLLMASLVSFVMWLPLTVLALNHGEPMKTDAAAPPLTLNAKLVLLGLWTATAWLAALIVK